MKNLSSEVMKRFGGFSSEKQKLGEKMIALNRRANTKGGQQGLLKIITLAEEQRDRACKLINLSWIQKKTSKH